MTIDLAHAKPTPSGGPYLGSETVFTISFETVFDLFSASPKVKLPF